MNTYTIDSNRHEGEPQELSAEGYYGAREALLRMKAEGLRHESGALTENGVRHTTDTFYPTETSWVTLTATETVK